MKVLKRSPDLLNNVKIGQGQLRLIIQTYFVVPYIGNGHFDQVTQKWYHIYSFIHWILHMKFDALGIKFGLAVIKINVNPDSSFVQTW